MAEFYTRRAFGRLALTAVPLASTLPFVRLAGAQGSGSVIEGVRVGAISGSFTGTAAQDIIPAMRRIGLTEIELVSTHVEALAGAPGGGARGAGPGGAAGAPAGPPTLNADGLLPRCANMPVVITPAPWSAGGGRGRGAGTPEQQAAAQRLAEWRAATTPATWQGVRKQFADNGINIGIVWYSLGFMGADTPDETIDYAFRMAQGLGVKVMSGSSTLTIARRIAPIAEKYQMLWGGHTQDDIHDPEQFATPQAYERLLALSPNFRINLDIGYFTAGGFDALAFVKQHHAKITDIHLKDRKRSRSLGGDVTSNAVNNYPFGQGDAPIREVLQLIKREKYDIPVTIEYDYGCRTTANAETEIARCYEYVKNALRG